MLNGFMIIESDSNDNGQYIKFANGIMICFISKSYTASADFEQDGSIYRKSFNSINFPVSFTDVPVVTGTFNTSNRTRQLYCSMYGITKTSINTIWGVTHWNASEASGTIQIIAIGHWK